MMRRFHWAAAVFLLLPVSAAPNPGIIQVTGVRAFSHLGSTRVIVETTGPAEFHADRAHDPDRLYFDILHARPWIDGHRIATRQIGDSLVKRVRVAETTPGTTRIVFDLVGQAQYTVSRLDTPDRIVIELTSSTAAPPLVSRATVPQIRPGIRDQKDLHAADSSEARHALDCYAGTTIRFRPAGVCSLPDSRYMGFTGERKIFPQACRQSIRGTVCQHASERRFLRQHHYTRPACDASHHLKRDC